MPIVRIIVIGLALWVLWLLIKGATRRLSGPTSEKPKPKSSAKIVKCDVCGLHIPENEALPKDGKFYCSEQHRDQHS